MLNLTQHVATPSQIADGVIEPTAELKAAIVKLINFTGMPTGEEIRQRAKAVAELAAGTGATTAMIGGALWFMGSLERALVENGIEPFYSYTSRQSVDERLPDGSVRKVAIFVHEGFIPAVL